MSSNEDNLIKMGKEIQSDIEQNANDLFGNMRSLTKEEQKQQSDYLESISTSTGVNFYDLIE